MGNLINYQVIKMNDLKTIITEKLRHKEKMDNYWKKEQKQDLEKANQSKPTSQGQEWTEAMKELAPLKRSIDELKGLHIEGKQVEAAGENYKAYKELEKKSTRDIEPKLW